MEFSHQVQFAAVLPLKKYHPLVKEAKSENAEKPELTVLKKKHLAWNENSVPRISRLYSSHHTD
jgi:hypothetical protein